MSRVMAFTLVRLMVAFMVLECVLTAFLPNRSSESTITHVSAKTFSGVLWTALVTGSEGEKIEELGDKAYSVRIADLQQNIFFLSQVHTIPRQFIPASFHHQHPPSFLALLCILMI